MPSARAVGRIEAEGVEVARCPDNRADLYLVEENIERQDGFGGAGSIHHHLPLVG